MKQNRHRQQWIIDWEDPTPPRLPFYDEKFKVWNVDSGACGPLQDYRGSPLGPIGVSDKTIMKVSLTIDGKKRVVKGTAKEFLEMREKETLWQKLGFKISPPTKD